VSALAKQHACNPTLLSSTLALGEGLLEYAKSEGLSHTSALLSSTILKVHARLEQVQGSRPTAPAAASNALSMSNHEASAKVQSSSASTSGGGSICELLLHKGGLKKRLPRPYVSQGVKAALPQLDSEGTAAPTQTIQPTIKDAVKCTLRGFHSAGLEQQYKLWVAASYQRMILMYSLLLCCWVASSGVRLAREGVDVFLPHLPMHLLNGLPYFISLLLAVFRQHR
jgi:hypothetical protein